MHATEGGHLVFFFQFGVIISSVAILVKDSGICAYKFPQAYTQE